MSGFAGYDSWAALAQYVGQLMATRQPQPSPYFMPTAAGATPAAAQYTAAPAAPPIPSDPFQYNQQFIKPGQHTYNTALNPQEEQQFRAWMTTNNVPFDPSAAISDYDMRGFWKGLQSNDPRAVSAIDPNDSRLHYPDYWKTPYHQTFSNQSQWALPTAPHWTDDDKLVGNDGTVLFDDRAANGASQ